MTGAQSGTGYAAESIAAALPGDEWVHRAIERHAAATPGANAIVFDDVALTYAWLNDAANRLAGQLVARHRIGPGARIAIAMARGPDMVVAILATLKAGAAYVPLDPACPAARMQFMIADSGCRVLLTGPGILPNRLLPPAGTALLQLETANDRPAPPCAQPDFETPGLSANDLAYIIYTSGSTGTPKGVMVEHRNLASSTAARLHIYGGYRTFLLLSPIFFDSSVAGLFGTLAAGGCLVIPKEESLRNPEALIGQIERHGVDSLLCVPSLLAILLDERVPRTGRSLHALRQVIVAGETCPASLVARAARALPAATLFNEYGPTEATVWATVHRCTGAASAASVPIGRPIPNAHIHILDPQGRQVPAGDTGEIHIGGAGVARGYVNRPDLTAERFLPDPFTADGTGRLYRTGDLGCWRRDGAIEFHGRIDHQLKIRGIRVEPGEIEAALLHHPCVREAAALAQDDAHLVAYVTLRGGPVSPAALSAHLAATLPDYMLPSRIVQVAAFPLTPNGKLDRAALAVLAPLPGSVPPGPPPRTPDEALLCRLFARLTGHDCVDVNSDFFEIGGDSLDAMILLTELRQSGRDLPLGQLFATRTPAAIAASWSPDPPPPPDAARPTLFIIPGSGSYDPRLAVLLLDWAPQIDCVLLDYPDWPVLSDPGFGMDALLAHFAARIAAHDHRGKLLLAGYSLGGFVAWALARRLARTPRPLDLLAIIDSDYSQLQQAMTPEAAASRAARRLHAATTLLGVEGGAEAARMLGEIAAYRLAIRPATLRFLARFRRLRLPPRFRTWLRMILCGELQTGIVTRWRAAESSVPETLLCRRVVLFQAVANENRAPHGRGWPARCASLAIEDVTGDHATLLGCRDPQSLYAKLPLALAEAAAVPGDRAMNPAECAQVSDAVT